MNNHTVIIREAHQQDIKPLVGLMEQLGYPTTEEVFKVRIDALEQHSDYQIFVAEVEEQVVGMIGLIRELRFERDGVHVRIGSIVVDEQYRGAGIGHSLVQAAEGWAASVGAQAIALNSGNRDERSGAHEFYRKLGFAGLSTGFVKKL